MKRKKVYKKRPEEKRVPIWTTLGKQFDEQINLIAESRRWTRPDTLRNLVQDMLSEAVKLDEKHGRGYGVQNLFFNAYFSKS
jgi:hypothetical protein